LSVPENFADEFWYVVVLVVEVWAVGFELVLELFSDFLVVRQAVTNKAMKTKPARNKTFLLGADII
jgi:hypothetical protein